MVFVLLLKKPLVKIAINSMIMELAYQKWVISAMRLAVLLWIVVSSQQKVVILRVNAWDLLVEHALPDEMMKAEVIKLLLSTTEVIMKLIRVPLCQRVVLLSEQVVAQNAKIITSFMVVYAVPVAKTINSSLMASVKTALIVLEPLVVSAVHPLVRHALMVELLFLVFARSATFSHLIVQLANQLKLAVHAVMT